MLISAKLLNELDSDKAPEEWEEIENIKAAKPFGAGVVTELHRLKDTDICLWLFKSPQTKFNWFQGSQFYCVIEDPENKIEETKH